MGNKQPFHPIFWLIGPFVLLLVLFDIGCVPSDEKNIPLDQPIQPITPSITPSIDPGTSCQSDSDCITRGCSGTLCQSVHEEQVITICEWQEKYQCYQRVSCTCISNTCQWSNEEALNACLEGYS